MCRRRLQAQKETTRSKTCELRHRSEKVVVYTGPHRVKSKFLSGWEKARRLRTRLTKDSTLHHSSELPQSLPIVPNGRATLHTAARTAAHTAPILLLIKALLLLKEEVRHSCFKGAKIFGRYEVFDNQRCCPSNSRIIDIYLGSP